MKNLSHIRFGRMQRRQEEAQHALLVNELDRLLRESGASQGLTDTFKAEYVRGAGELELVRSGLDDTMRTAYQSMREVWHGRNDVDDLGSPPIWSRSAGSPPATARRASSQAAAKRAPARFLLRARDRTCRNRCVALRAR